MNKILVLMSIALVSAGCSSVNVTPETQFNVYYDFCFQHGVPAKGKPISVTLNDTVFMEKWLEDNGAYTCSIREEKGNSSVSRIAYSFLSQHGKPYRTKDRVGTDTLRDFTYKMNLNDKMMYNITYLDKVQSAGLKVFLTEMVEGDVPESVIKDRSF